VNDSITLWDRKIEGRFPEAKEVKRLVRDIVAPTRDLGHSDVAKTGSSDMSALSDDCIECKEDKMDLNNTAISILDDPTIGNKSPHVCITYCTGCRWMLRASWCAQELLSTFSEEINSITLIPSRPPAPGGQFVSISCCLKSSYAVENTYHD
jgi:predicted Rdx family selenoprotein